MSRIVDKDALSSGDVAKLYKEGKVTKIRTTHRKFPKPIRLWGFDGKRFWVPPTINIKSAETKTYREYHNKKEKCINFEFHGTLYTSDTDPKSLKRDQDEIFVDALENLANHGSVFLHLSTGFGKSMLGLALIHALQRKACIIVYSKKNQKDWVERLKKLTTAKYHHYSTTKEPPMDTDIDIMGLMKSSKLTPQFLSRYQTVLIDEADEMPADTTLPIMKKIAPDFLIGMSATIERSDGLHSALFKYFGEKKYFIYRFIKKPLATIIKYQTEFRPELEYDSEGNINTTLITNSIASNKKRHSSVAKLIRSLKGKKMLILSDRIEEIKSLVKLIMDLDHDYCTDKKKDMDKNRRILIGGYKACGRGYDVPGLDVVILLTSFRNVKQYEGRLRSECGVIYDFVDNAPILESRWKTRLTWYRKREFQIKFQIDGENEIKDYKPARSRKRYVEVDIL